MATYTVQLSDGRIVELEGDREPTEADVLSALGAASPSAPEGAFPSLQGPASASQAPAATQIPPADPRALRGEALRGELAAMREARSGLADWFGADNPTLPQALLSAATPPLVQRGLDLARKVGVLPQEQTQAEQAYRALTGVLPEALSEMSRPTMLPILPLALVPGVREALALRFGGEAIGSGLGEASVGVQQGDLPTAAHGLGVAALGSSMVAAPVTGVSSLPRRAATLSPRVQKAVYSISEIPRRVSDRLRRAETVEEARFQQARPVGEAPPPTGEALVPVRTPPPRPPSPQEAAAVELGRALPRRTQERIAEAIAKQARGLPLKPDETALLQSAQSELDAWTRTLSERVEAEVSPAESADVAENWLREAQAQAAKTPLGAGGPDAALKVVADGIRKATAPDGSPIPPDTMEALYRELQPTRDLETGETLDITDPDWPRTGTLLNFLESRAQARMPAEPATEAVADTFAPRRLPVTVQERANPDVPEWRAETEPQHRERLLRNEAKFARSLEAQPDDPRLLANLANVRARLGKTADAQRELDAAKWAARERFEPGYADTEIANAEAALAAPEPQAEVAAPHWSTKEPGTLTQEDVATYAKEDAALRADVDRNAIDYIRQFPESAEAMITREQGREEYLRLKALADKAEVAAPGEQTAATPEAAWFHATHANVSEMAPREVASVDSVGTWVTGDPKAARTLYGPNVVRVEATPKNLLEAHTENFDEFFFANRNLFEELFPNEPVATLQKFKEKGLAKSDPRVNQMRATYLRAFRQMLEDAGHDGVVWKDSRIDTRKGDAPHTVAVLFHKEALTTTPSAAPAEVAPTPAEVAPGEQLTATTPEATTSSLLSEATTEAPPEAAKATTGEWRRVPSATGGGKPFFSIIDTPAGRKWVSWNRNAQQWEVSGEQEPPTGRSPSHGLFKTEPEAKAFVERTFLAPTTPEAAPAEAAPATPTPPRASPLAEAWERFDSTGEIETARDLADTVEALVAEGKAPATLQRAVDKYRKVVAEDFAMAGRGDLDTAEAAFTSAVRKAARAKTPARAAPKPAAPAEALDVSPILTATTPEQVTKVGGRMAIEAKTASGLQAVQAAMQKRSAELGAPQETTPDALFVKEGRTLRQVTPEQASRGYGKGRDRAGEGASGLSSMRLYNAQGKVVAKVSYNGNVWREPESKPRQESDLLYNATGLTWNAEKRGWDLPKLTEMPPGPGALGIAPPGSEYVQRAIAYFTPPRPNATPEIKLEPGSVLPRLQDYRTESLLATTPHGMARVPVLGQMVDPRAKAHTEPDRAVITRAYSNEKGQTLAAIWAQSQWRNRKLWQADPETGTMTLADGSRGYMSDVVEAELREPGSQALSPEQRQWITETWVPLRAAIDAYMRDEGLLNVELEDMDYDPRVNYFPRPTIGKRGVTPPEGMLSSSTRPGAKPFFQKRRLYETEAEGARPPREGEVKEQIVYDPSGISRVAKLVAGVHRAVADRRLANDPSLGGRTATERFEEMRAAAREQLDLMTKEERAEAEAQMRIEAAHPIWQREAFVDVAPAFMGKIYPIEVATKLRRAYAGETGHVIQAIANVTAASKAMSAVGDLSQFFIQGAALFGTHPAQWTRSVVNSLRALYDTDVIGKLMEKPHYRQAIDEASQAGVTLLRLQDFLAGARKGALATELPKAAGRVLKRGLTAAGMPRAGSVAGFVASLPGHTIERLGLSYGVFLDVAKLELWRAYSEVTPREQWGQLAETVENGLFMGRMEQIGLNPHRAVAERLLAFAMMYYRGAGGLITTAMLRGVPARVARRMIGGYMLAGVLTAVAGWLYAGLDWDEIKRRLDPRRGKFLMVPIKHADGSQSEVGFGNILTQLFRLGFQIYDHHANPKPISTGAEADPYIRFARGRSAFLPSLFFDLATGRDYMGEPISKTEAITRRFIPFALQALFPRGERPTGEQRVSDAAFTFFGLRAFSEGEAAAERRKLDEMAREEHGAPFTELPLARRAALMQKRQLSPEWKVRETTQRDMERFIAIDAERTAKLADSLAPEARQKLERLGLAMPGYRATLIVRGQSVPLSDDEQLRYEALLKEEYDRAIGERIDEPRWASMLPGRREEDWRLLAARVRERARTRLTREIATTLATDR